MSRKAIFALSIFIIFVISIFFHSYFINRNNPDLNSSYQLLTNWFIHNQSREGDFPYQFHTTNGEVASKSASIEEPITVRKLLSLHALSLIYLEKKEPQLKETIEKGLAFYSPYIVRGESNLNGRNISIQRVQYKDEDLHNSSAFLLLTLLEFVKAEPSKKAELEDTIHQLANYLLITQLPSGGFKASPHNEKESPYNNGETLYALVRYSRDYPNPQFIQAVERSANYFMEEYAKFDNSFYIWGVSSFYQLYKLSPKQEYWHFMKNQTDQFFSNRGKQFELFLYQNQVPAPAFDIIVYTEGISQVALLAKEKGESQYFERLKKLTQSSIYYMIKHQINGPTRERKSSFAQLTGSMCLDPLCKVSRIDMNAHTLTAMYYYFKLD